MKKAQSKKYLMMLVGVVVVVVGVGLYAVRSGRIDDNTWWQYDDPEISEEEEDIYVIAEPTGDGEIPSINVATTREAPAYDSLCLGPDYVEGDWNSSGGNPNDLSPCGETDETKGGCVNMILNQESKGTPSCQAIRPKPKDPVKAASLLNDYGIDLSSVSEAGCRGEAFMKRSWKAALLGPKCQPGLLFNQKSITSDTMVDKYTGASKAKPINVDRMHACTPGLAGRKHPVATKGSEVLNLDPGHPDKVNTYGNSSPSLLPDKGLQPNIAAYRDAGYTVTWEEYHTPVKAACECATERPANIKGSGKILKFCAKTGPAQVKLEGSKACHTANKPQFCCPAGKQPSSGKCV